jgi:hypothetical protein
MFGGISLAFLILIILAREALNNQPQGAGGSRFLTAWNRQSHNWIGFAGCGIPNDGCPVDDGPTYHPSDLLRGPELLSQQQLEPGRVSRW